MAHGQEGHEATLLIKADTLTLRHLLVLRRFQVFFLLIGSRSLAYGVRIIDDPEHPAILWSPLEYQDEIDAIRTLMARPDGVVFLFNELAVNVAWSNVAIHIPAHNFTKLIGDIELQQPELPGRTVNKIFAEEVSRKLEAWYRKEISLEEIFVSDVCEVSEWKPLDNHFITNRAETGLISIADSDEGDQQEQIAHWLTDSLKPDGAFKSPQVHEAGKVRELCDVLISHEYGAVLIESKTLNMSARSSIPNREKLSRDIQKHIRKATAQLVGAVKNLRRLLPVTDQKGNKVDVNREVAPHVIILVPDLGLLGGTTEFGKEFLIRNAGDANAYFHILDPTELLRMVQAASMIAKRGKTTTPIMAFDYHILERFKRAIKLDTPDFDFLLRFESDSEGGEGK